MCFLKIDYKMCRVLLMCTHGLDKALEWGVRGVRHRRRWLCTPLNCCCLSRLGFRVCMCIMAEEGGGGKRGPSCVRVVCIL